MAEGKIIVKHRFVPMRILAKSGKSSDLIVEVYNETPSPILLSFDFEVPKNALIGFDSTTSRKKKTVKLNKIEPYSQEVFYVTIYTTNQTPPYDYPLRYTINYHVDDYSKVLDKKVRMCHLKVI